MKVFLMHRDRDLELERALPAHEDALTRDLELDTLFDAMAGGDAFLYQAARRALLLSLTEPEAISYRQQILADCLRNPGVVRRLYDVALAAIQAEKDVRWGFLRDSPDAILHRSVQVLEKLLPILRELRAVAEEHAGALRSDGFRRLFATLAEELDDAYLETVEQQLRALKFRRGVLIGAQLGKGNKGRRYVVRKPHERSWRERLPLGGRTALTFTISDRDENGFRALSELRGKGINGVANALAQSTDHVVGFFTMLRAELAFYLGCLNLHERLAEKGEPTCFPDPVAPGSAAFSARGLYDVCLAFHVDGQVVGNDVDADGKSLVMVTGANQGGKSTFLRSVGLAHLMLQSGMLVPAEQLRADVASGIFTHYTREEDATMTSGKLDEELSRMSEIADTIPPGSVLLCNESFSATNEREGSEIARQVVRAATEAGVKVFFVTHLYDLAQGLHRQGLDGALFLRAERRPDGRRTFRLLEGEPLATSYGEDSYKRIFGGAAAAKAAASG